jgi:hypothetical protein
VPTVATHDADVPRVAIYSQWSGTQNLGWYRLTFDEFGIPFDLIYKEQVKAGKLRDKYDVILIAEQNLSRQTVMQAPAARPQPYKKNDKYKFLGMYGETDDMSGGMGQAGVDAFAAFLEAGGTLIAVGESARLPIEFGWARTVDKTPGCWTHVAASARGRRDRAPRASGVLWLRQKDVAGEVRGRHAVQGRHRG